MARDWETQFSQWASPPPKTEQERCDNAVSAITNAIKASNKLKNRGVVVFAQGSYRNRTNVRHDSDVDVGVVCKNVFFYDLPEGTTEQTFNIIQAEYTFRQFKDEVGEALISYFSKSAVERGNKAFDIHETNYHVEADVAPFFQYRRYRQSGSYFEGVELRCDQDNRRIINWPEQHYANGVDKNDRTGTRYKSIVRILKSLSNEMADKKIQYGEIPGFLAECLAWNVHDELFQNNNYSDDVRAALLFLYGNTKEDILCHEWGEVSELKYLFQPSQKWTREQANAFIVAAWDYIGFGD